MSSLSLPPYEPAPMGTNALKRLGKAIASREPLTADQQALYREFITDAKQRVQVVRAAVEYAVELAGTKWLPRVAGAEVTGRDKTLSTLVDKLLRSPTEQLPSIHDVAGVRVVFDASLAEQVLFANLVGGLIDLEVGTSRPFLLIDRLQDPRYGYRAVHVIVWPGGRPVEIQVRTVLQHGWAQLMEVLGDRWGRELRYGEPLKAADALELGARESTVETMQALSELIRQWEEQAVVEAPLHIDPAGPTFNLPIHTDEARAGAERWRDQHGGFFFETKRDIMQVLDVISEAVKSSSAVGDGHTGTPGKE